MRKSLACDECKQRKIRCSGGDRCSNCARDPKDRGYSSTSQRLVSLQRSLRERESLRSEIERAWKLHLPEVDFQTALRDLSRTPEDVQLSRGSNDSQQESKVIENAMKQTPMAPSEPNNAEDHEFDEFLDVEGSIDGMAYLTADQHKAGYTGPRSGIATLKFLQSLPSFCQSAMPHLCRLLRTTKSQKHLLTTLQVFTAILMDILLFITRHIPSPTKGHFELACHLCSLSFSVLKQLG
ncbi:hypothetical protein F5Y16DRAFT_37156 [Xylariaceae sp. FL0255]|nr:hypothetical protein F5Y16DRAFT_37156 [Xylariaceae sp. FL0255]